MFAKTLESVFQRHPRVTAAAICSIGLCLTLAGSIWLNARNASIAADRFAALVQDVTSQIEGRLARYEYGLRGARGAYVATSNGGMTRVDFNRYSLTRDIDQEFPGARGFGIVRRVRSEDEAAFLARSRADGAPSFQIRQITPHTGDRAVVQFIEPMATNRQALGLDIASEDRRREAAWRAMETGRATLTAPITLLQAAGLKEGGFVLFLPIRDPMAVTNTPTERQAATRGWSFAPLVINDVLAGLHLDLDRLAFSLADRTLEGSTPFFSTPSADEEPAGGLSRVVETTIFDRIWTVSVRARPKFVSDLQLASPLLLAGFGGVLSLLAASVGYLRLSGRRRMVLADHQKSRLAAIVQTTDDAIIGKTVAGIVTDWNPAAERLFGYFSQEACGRSFADLVIPADRRDEETETLTYIRQGEHAPRRSTLRRHRDGTLIAVQASAAPIRAENGQVIGIATTIRDIRDQVVAQERIYALNASLERQVTERTAELKASSALQSAILANAGYAVIATDVEGVITLFNPAAERMLGYAAEALIGRASPGLFHDPAEVVARAKKLSGELGEPIEPGFDVFVARTRRGLPNIEEWTYITSQGARLPVRLNVSALRAADGQHLGFLGIALDLTERHRHEDEMRAANAGTWNYDVATGRVWMSSECARQHGLEDAEVEIDVETGWKPLAHPDDVTQVLSDLQNSVLTGGSYTTEFRIQQPNGGTRWVAAMGQTEADASGAVTRVIGLTLDVTARKEAELALRDAQTSADAARTEAERANGAKTDFLAAMSHEIRTPLNAIIGFTDLMTHSGRLDPDTQTHAEIVHTAGMALLTVVNDILDFSKIEAGAVELDLGAFAPRTLINNCLSIVQSLAASKGLDVQAVVDPGLPEALRGDESRLQQILLNLLNNAVKFTHAGSITLTVRQEASGAVDERLRFSVTDTGIGIPAEKQYRLFQRFSQVDGSIQRDFGGTGLGLAISKRLVDLMGGEIGVISEAKRGSTFWFTLTLPRTQAGSEAPTRAGAAAPGQIGRILLVEDIAVNQELACLMLRGLGHVVDVADDGFAAVRAVAAEHYDLVLMDVQMPGLNGIMATRLIRCLPGEAARVPIVAMTANVLPDEIQAFREAGMDDHFGKPFVAADLNAMIARWMPQRTAPAAPPTAEAGVPAEAAIDRKRYEESLALLPPAAVERLLQHLHACVVGGFPGMPDAVADRDRLRAEAHALTSVSGMLGFVPLCTACGVLDGHSEARIAEDGREGFDIALARARALAASAAFETQRMIAEMQDNGPAAAEAGGQ